MGEPDGQGRPARPRACWYERSYIGPEYLKNFRRAAQFEGDPDRRRGADRADRSGHLRRGRRAARGGRERDRPLRVRARVSRRSTPRSHALDWDPPRYMGTAFETGFNEHLWDAYRGWIGLEQYDEGEPGRSAVPRRVRSGVRPPSRVLRPAAVARLRDVAPVRVRRRRAAVAAGGQGGARAGEDAAGRVRLAAARASRSARGSTAAGSARATWWRARSIPTARSSGSTGSRRWSVATARTEQGVCDQMLR